MATTLNKQAMPIGWESRLDPRTGRFYFINHGEHITTWEDPRIKSLSQLQGETIPLQDTYAGYYLYGIGRPPGTPHKGGVIPFYGSPRTSPKVAPKDMGMAVRADEKMVGKMCMQFPTVDEGYIRKLMKKYNNREHVVVSALMSEGHPRAATHNTPELPVKSSTKAPVMVDCKLAIKLRTIFPTVDEDWLYNLLSRHNNNEEDVVASLVSAGYPFTQSPFQTSRGSRSSSGRSSPKMKLRYLKSCFPEADEAILFDVLINCDNQTQDSMTRLTTMGYKKQDSPVPKSSKTSNESAKANPVPPPQTFSIAIDKVKVKQKLREEFKDVSDTVITMALESTQFNETKARHLLTAMTPQQDSRPVIGTTEPIKIPEDLILSSLKRSHPPSTGDSSTSSVASQHSTLERKQTNIMSSALSLASKLSSEGKMDGSPKPPPRTKGVSDVKRLSYDLQEAKEDKPDVTVSSFRTNAVGPNPSIRKGPDNSLLRKIRSLAKGPKAENRKGTNPELHRGANKENVQYSGSRLAKGPQRNHCQGPQSNLTKPASTSSTTTSTSHFQGQQSNHSVTVSAL
ncbi:hypothetical protein GQR58_003859 [Nymphon striatum]|nr:hypothetical protein GQR58_003859 [Nymphon striatum]